MSAQLRRTHEFDEVQLALCAVVNIVGDTARWFSWLECRPVTAEVTGSSPVQVAICGNSSVVEHLLAKEGVASSNLVFRSIFLGA